MTSRIRFTKPAREGPVRKQRRRKIASIAATCHRVARVFCRSIDAHCSRCHSNGGSGGWSGFAFSELDFLVKPLQHLIVGGKDSPHNSALNEVRGGKGLMTSDQQLICIECDQEFTFSSEDKAFFQKQGYSTPKRCKACRQAKKNDQGGGRDYRETETPGTAVICSMCGKQTTVPFEPIADRPVYCRACYISRKRSSGWEVRRGPR